MQTKRETMSPLNDERYIVVLGAATRLKEVKIDWIIFNWLLKESCKTISCTAFKIYWDDQAKDFSIRFFTDKFNLHQFKL